MAHDQNWEKREFVSFTPQFRIDVNNPQVGFNGSGIYDLYGTNDQGDVSLAGMTQGGIYRLYNDRTIEIVAGNKSERGGVDICITGLKGSVLITAQENGEIRIKGASVVVEAKENMTLKAGGDFKLDVAGKIDMYAKEAYLDAPHSYGPKAISTGEGETFLNRVYDGLKAESIAEAASAAAGGPGVAAAVSVAQQAISALS